MLAAKDVIKTLFIVINADDYYGKEGFKAVHEYLVNGGKSCMACFVLMNNTLSDNCGVTRGICKMSVKVLKTNVTWYGMTYYEDVAAVKDSFKKCWRMECTRLIYLQTCDILGAVAPYAARNNHTPLRGEQ